MDHTHGFALARKPEKLLAHYHASQFAQKNQTILRDLRQAFEFLDPASYRGISRNFLPAFPSLDPKILAAFAESGSDMETEQHARTRFRHILGENPDDDDEYDDLLFMLSDAQDVFNSLDAPEDFEILELSREPYHLQSDSLGFDIGYWRGDHFSLICDSVIMPTWHPPVPEDFTDLSRLLRCLNTHCLFSTIPDVTQFYEYYITRSWAETEAVPGEFCIIHIGLPKTTK